MPRKRHSPEQTIRKLRQAEAELAAGLVAAVGTDLSRSPDHLAAPLAHFSVGLRRNENL